MIQINTEQVTDKFKALFDFGAPAGLRAFTVMEGMTSGQIFTDNPDNPTWGVVRESTYGTFYLGGTVSAEQIAQFINDFRKLGDEVLAGFWPDDPNIQLLPKQRDYEGTVYDFIDHPIGEGLDALLEKIPEGCTIQRVDAELFERSSDRDMNITMYGSKEKALEKGMGFFLLRGDEIVCETFGGPAIRGMFEIGVGTQEVYRGRGYATFTCAHLIQACEQMGYQTYWNCNSANIPSVKLAQKLGYRTQKAYTLFAWFKPSAQGG
ncbi:MAG: GNAT family N-acetyltransferase [Anaerolineae bacterium]|nr:GNAT family N-acetyltransferase [Anaerolineae bacterium]